MDECVMAYQFFQVSRKDKCHTEVSFFQSESPKEPRGTAAAVMSKRTQQNIISVLLELADHSGIFFLLKSRTASNMVNDGQRRKLGNTVMSLSLFVCLLSPRLLQCDATRFSSHTNRTYTVTEQPNKGLVRVLLHPFANVPLRFKPQDEFGRMIQIKVNRYFGLIAFLCLEP